MLNSRPLCRAEIELAEGAPFVLGQTPWRNRRLSPIAGGRFEGDRLGGEITASGADWSELGIDEAGDALTLIDVRSMWKTDDGALIHVSYGGRLIIPKASLAAFRDPEAVETLPPDAYHFRITPLFETSDPRYAWLNRIVAAGIGRRTASGVSYDILELA